MGMGLELCGCGKKNQEEEETHTKQDTQINQSTPLTNIETPSSSPLTTQNTQNPNIDDLILIDRAILIGKGKGDFKEKYDIGKKLGGGTFGQVYLCTNKKTNEKVAVKMLRKNKKNNKLNKEILNEIDLLKNLDHRNIINIFEFYEGSYIIYIVTQYCKSGNLFQYVRKTNNYISEAQVSVILFQILSAINYCHQQNIIHRDIKPENIMLDDNSKSGYPFVRLIDFGTSKYLENEYENELIGTPYFIAPEVIKRRYDSKCDIWSIGILLYFLISKKRPFDGKKLEEIFDGINNKEINFSIKPFDTTSEELKDLILKLLKKNPNERLTAQEALNHPWFTKNKTKEKLSYLSTTEMNELLDNIRNYNPKNVLQQIALSYLVNKNPNAETVNKASCLFIKLDKDNNGIIDNKEFVHGLKTLFDEEGKNVDEEFLINNFKRIDSNNNGNIEYEEFIRAAIDKKEFLNEDIMKEAFDHFDKDDSGQITVDEIANVFGFNERINEFSSIIEECDIDQNGSVELDEFIYIMEKIIL